MRAPLLVSALLVVACSDRSGTVVTAPLDTSATTDSEGTADVASPADDLSTPAPDLFEVPDTSATDLAEPLDVEPPRDLPPPPVDVPEIPDGANCAPGSGFCDGKTLFYCLADGSGVVGKECTNSCEKGACVGEPKLCQPSAVFCDKPLDRILKCSADGLSATFVEVCSFGCNVKTAACKDDNDCTQDETFCAGDQKSVLVCNETETEFVLKEKCPFGCGAGECLPPACEKDATQCGETGVDVCKADQTGFQQQTACPAGCLIAFEVPTCAQCKLNTLRCDGYDVERCTDPLVGWDYEETCTFEQTCAQGDCVELLLLEEPRQSALYAIANAFLACIDSGQAVTCGGFQTLGLNADVSLEDLRDAVCASNTNGEVEAWFPSSNAYSKAYDLFGCGLLDQVEVKFEISAIHADQDGQECYRYTGGGGFFSDDIVVGVCE